MLVKLAKFIEIVFDATLNAVKSLLWMIIVTILAVTAILSGAIATVAHISNK